MVRDASTWCEVDHKRLAANARYLKNSIGKETLLSVAVKANGYGHGIVIAAEAFVEGGADWLCVHSVQEAKILREHGILVPIHLVGPVPLSLLHYVESLNLSMVVYNRETVEHLSAHKIKARLHLKVETGNHRQGVGLSECVSLANQIVDVPHLELEGLCTHFSDIEDTTDHRFARAQIQRFEDVSDALSQSGISIAIRHVSNTAATLLWDDLPYEMVRVGIGAYGLWPSKETQIAALLAKKNPPQLGTALSWKTWIAQVKSVEAGAYIGYGRTFRTTQPTVIAVLPIGYADGFDRQASNRGFVLCGGHRAPILGRICMNMMMIDVTHIKDVCLGDEVVLLGNQGGEVITPEHLADWTHTINYEVISRIGTHVPRIVGAHQSGSNLSDQPYRKPKLSDRK